MGLAPDLRRQVSSIGAARRERQRRGRVVAPPCAPVRPRTVQPPSREVGPGDRPTLDEQGEHLRKRGARSPHTRRWSAARPRPGRARPSPARRTASGRPSPAPSDAPDTARTRRARASGTGGRTASAAASRCNRRSRAGAPRRGPATARTGRSAAAPNRWRRTAAARGDTARGGPCSRTCRRTETAAGHTVGCAPRPSGSVPRNRAATSAASSAGVASQRAGGRSTPRRTRQEQQRADREQPEIGLPGQRGDGDGQQRCGQQPCRGPVRPSRRADTNSRTRIIEPMNSMFMVQSTPL